MKEHNLADLRSALKASGVSARDRGTVLEFKFSRNFVRQLELFAPGCGSRTHVPGTNGGQMECGAWLTWMDGTRIQQFCGYCESQLNAPAVVCLSQCPVSQQGNGRDGLVVGPV